MDISKCRLCGFKK